MTDQAKELRAALSHFDLGMVGKIMHEHHGILRGLNFSHEQIEVLINIASKQGALGAKLTGGGMGGYIVALTSDADQRERVAQAIEEKGFRTLQVSIGP